MLDINHHHGPTPLLRLGIGMVSCFPQDYMHLVCLGVTRKLIMLWMKGPLKTRLGPRVIDGMSTSLISLRSFIPCEFARKPRSMREYLRWKATEFRQFLLYTGPVILHSSLRSTLYKNFLLLFVGIFILISPSLSVSHCDYAHQLIVLFVQHFGSVYGKSMLTYNVHCLSHLASDVKQHGSLDNFSGFPFENFLKSLKRLIRKPTSPLQQVIRRLSEQTYEPKKVEENDRLQKPHNDGPLPVINRWPCFQYKELHMEDYTIKLNEADNCVQIDSQQSRHIVVVQNIYRSNDVDYILARKFMSEDSFFTYPLDSCILGIYTVSNLSDQLHVVAVTDIVNNMETPKYAVVVFTEEDGVSMVPISWCIDDSNCYWPPYKSTLRFQKSVRMEETPGANWTTHAIRILSRTDSYDKARMQMIRAEDTSDLQSDAETTNKRRKRVNRKYLSSDEDADEDSDNDNLVAAPSPPLPPSTSSVLSTPSRRALLSASSPNDSQPSLNSSYATSSGFAETPSSGYCTESNLAINVKKTINSWWQHVEGVCQKNPGDVLSNAVATKLNWTGTTGKTAFAKLHMRNIIEKAVRRNQATVQSTTSDIQAAVVRFLKGASDREGGRKSRTTPQTVDE
ncbi:hypothetical protein BSL78_20370 [Apostichopus japonicus]|uniref:Uncharacterized protein n=1 Tax=Stichopus japonicus TaxID=307972 RepID=A0A2G8K440_STIJA|nr:hypothetical protein BSL78_20370 [Apostichopus japonicus]